MDTKNLEAIFTITFEHDSSEIECDTLVFSVDDLVFSAPEDMTVAIVNDKTIVLDDFNGNSVHVDIEESSFVCPEKNLIEFRGTFGFMWADDAGETYAINAALTDFMDIYSILMYGTLDTIVPYTQNRLLENLKVRSLSILVDNDKVTFDPASCERIITEQYYDGYIYTGGSVKEWLEN